MARDWKVRLNRRLMEGDVEAWTTGMLWNEALATAAPPLSILDRQDALHSGIL